MNTAKLTYTEVSPRQAKAGEVVNVKATIDTTAWFYENVWLNVYVKETGKGIIYWSGSLILGISSTKTGTFTMPDRNVTVVFEAYHHDGTKWIKDATIEKSVTLIIVKERTSMGLEVYHIGGGSYRARANLFTSAGVPLSGKTIKFYRNGTYLGSAVTGADGYASITFKPPAGRWTILAKFEGDDRYYPSQISAMIDVTVVEEIATKFTDVRIDKTEAYEGDTVTVSAYLKDANNKPLANVPVRSYQDYAYTTIYTDATGRCVRTWRVPKLPAGTVVKFYFKYMGGTINMVVYKGSTSSIVSVTVKEKAPTEVPTEIINFTVSPATVNVGSPVTISGYLSTEESFWTQWMEYIKYYTGMGVKGAIQNAPIKIYVNGTVVGTVRTGSDGKFTYTWTPKTAGTFSVKAVFEGMTV